MVSRLRLLRQSLPALAILFASVTTCRSRATREEIAPASRTASDSEVIYEVSREALASAPLGRAREVLRAGRTLRPDRRFLLATAELVRLRDGRPPPPVRVSLARDGWRIHVGAEAVGTLSVIPSFEETDALLRRWAEQCLPAWRQQLPEPSGLAELESQARDPFGNGPIRALEESESLRRRGLRHPRLFDVAGSATLSLLAQSLDRLRMTDRLQAKALALLAARESMSGPQPESAAFLARWMGYGAEADLLAGELPETSPIRMWVLDQQEALGKDVARADAEPFGRYLYLLAVAEKEGLAAWARALASHSRRIPDGLPLIRTALNAPDFGPDRDNAIALLRALEAEVSQEPRAAAFWSQLRERLLETPSGHAIADLLRLVEPSGGAASVLERFEHSLARRLPAPGSFWNPETAGTYYRSLFYSALYTIGTYELDRRASARDAIDFADSLKGAPSGPGELFQRWFSALARFDDDRGNIAPLIQGLDEFAPLGRSAIKRIADELESAIPANDPHRQRVITTYAMHLDTRPSERTAYGSLCLTDLLDLHGYETYYGGGVAAYGRAAGGTEIAWAKYREDAKALRRMAAERGRSAHQRWAALQALAKARLATEDELVQRSCEIFADDPEGSYAHGEIVAFLRERRRYREAESLLRKRLESHPDEPALTKALYAARLSLVLVGQGRGKEAWATIEPWIDTWQGNALSAGSFALDAIGRRDEARRMARQALERYPTGPWTRVSVAELFWRQGRYGEVPALYQDAKHPPDPRDWVNAIAPTFRSVFAASAPEEVERAFAPFIDARFNPWYLSYFADPFAEVGRYDLAAAVMLQVTHANPGIGPLDPKLKIYRWLEKSRGEDEAIAWVRQNVPATHRRDLLVAALDERLFHLFWAVIDFPTPAPDGEDVWLLRATAAVLDPESARTVTALLRDHFASSTAPGSRNGRFLLGLSDETELLGASDRLSRGEAAYYLGIRALASGHRDEACDWFLVCLELLGDVNPTGQRAKRIVRRWAETGTGAALS